MQTQTKENINAQPVSSAADLKVFAARLQDDTGWRFFTARNAYHAKVRVRELSNVKKRAKPRAATHSELSRLAVRMLEGVM